MKLYELLKSNMLQIIAIVAAALGMLVGLSTGLYWVAMLNFALIIMNVCIIFMKNNDTFDNW
jgi:hypothetical protein